MQSWEKISNSHFPRTFAFFILSIIYLAYSLTAYADSGNGVNSTDNFDIKNQTTSQIPDGTNFSNIKCTSGLGHVLLTGQFHNANIAYRVIFLRMSIFDKSNNLLATGSGYISDIKQHEVEEFNAITRFSGNFSTCGVQIDNAIPK